MSALIEFGPDATTQTEKQEYRVFRKSFHVPMKWRSSPQFNLLLEHRYPVSNIENTFDFVYKSLKELGYAGNNKRMQHDYLHYMILDALEKENIPYVSEDEVRNLTEMKRFLNNLTPDIIIQMPNTKPLIVDIFTGEQDATKIEKYKDLRYFTVIIVKPTNFQSKLNKILPDNVLQYIQLNFKIFMTEYQYWDSCLEFRKILLNDSANIDEADWRVINPTAYEGLKTSFKNALLKSARNSDAIENALRV